MIDYPLKEYSIDAIDDIVTNADLREVAHNFALKMRGVLNLRQGMICERDKGTKRIHSSYVSNRTIIRHAVLYNAITAVEYIIIFAVDGANDSHILVWDSSWVEITAGTDIFMLANGATPFVRFSVEEVLGKANVYYGTSATPPVMRNPVEIKKWDQTDYFFATSTITNTTNASPIVITTSANHNFVTGDTVIITGVGGNTAANGTWVITKLSATTFSLNTSTGNGTYTSGGTAKRVIAAGWRMEKGGGGLIPTFKEVGTPSAPLDYTAHTIKSGTVSVDQDLSVVTGSGTAFLTDYQVGQYIQVGATTSRRRRRVATVASNISLTVEGTWPLTLSGVIHATISPTNTEIDDTPSGNWLRVRLFREEESSDIDNALIDKKYKTQVIITAMYDAGTKESDPIYRAYMGNANSAINTFARHTLALFVKNANMNKRISGLRIYEERSEQIDVADYGAWDNSGTAIRLMFEVTFNANQADAQWAANAEDPSNYDYKTILPDFTFSYVDTKLKAAAKRLVVDVDNPLPGGNLSHAIDTSRSYLPVRFHTKAARTQGAIVAVDQGDRTLRLSTYNGDIIHEEDNFPDVSTDTGGFVQKVALNGRGSIVALRVMDDVIYIFRENELETWDLQALETRLIPEPCVSGDSVVQSKYGISFGGTSAIKHIPRGGGAVYTLNPLWQNVWDGSLFIDDGTAQYLTDARRQVIIGGYHELYEEAWFVLELNVDADDGGSSEYVCAVYRYPKQRWRFRKLHIGSGLTVGAGQKKPVSLISRKDGSLSIAYADAILQYPNRSGSRMWEDDVNADDTTNSKGIETDIMFNIGGLSNAIPHAIVKGLKILHKGSTVDKSGFARLRLYANAETRAFDDKQFRIDDPAIWRGIDRRGSLEALRVRISLPTTAMTNFKDFDISEAILGYSTNGVQPQK